MARPAYRLDQYEELSVNDFPKAYMRSSSFFEDAYVLRFILSAICDYVVPCFILVCTQVEMIWS